MAVTPLERLIQKLKKLPGVGERTATRYALAILRSPGNYAEELAQAVQALRRDTRQCAVCRNLTETERCTLCEDARRDPSLICVVEEPADLLALEKGGEYRGLYHVLHGSLSPLEGVTPDQLQIASLLERAKNDAVKEVILATNPNLEGEATALYLREVLAAFPVRVTRIASGVPVGGDLEFLDAQTLAKALQARGPF